MLGLAAALLLAANPASPPPPSPPPAHAGARAGRPSLPEAALLGEWPASPSGKKVSIQGKVRVDKALQKIAEAGGWNLVANTGQAGDQTLLLNLRDAPVESALEAVLEGTSLAATRRGNSVTVAPHSVPVEEVPVLSGFDPPGGKKLTADFTDTPIGEALQKIADAGGWSVVLPAGLRGAVNAHFRNSPAEEALKAVLSQTGLSASREGSVVTVSRESGPRLVVRGGKRHLDFHKGLEGLSMSMKPKAPSKEDVRQLKEDALQAAEDARQAAEEDADDAASPSAKRGDRVHAGNINVAPGERLRDVVSIRGNVRLGPGAAARQVTAVLGSVDLDPGANVEQEVVAVGGNVHVGPGAHVAKDVVSVGGEVIIDPGGTVDGEQVSVSVPGLAALVGLVGSKSISVHEISPLLKVGHALAKFAVFFALALLVLVFVPQRLDAVTAGIGRRPAKVILAGLLGTLAMPVLTVLLVVTIVGIPLVAVQIVAVLVAGVVGYSALALFIGRALPVYSTKAAAVIQLAVGTAIVVAVSEVPILGPMAMLSAWLIVFGAVLRTRFGQAQGPAPLPTTPSGAPPQAA